LRDPTCDVSCISSKIQDGGQFITFSQNISRIKQDMKHIYQDFRDDFKRSFKRNNKIFCCHCPLKYNSLGIAAMRLDDDFKNNISKLAQLLFAIRQNTLINNRGSGAF
jgi:ribosomal protein S17E